MIRSYGRKKKIKKLFAFVVAASVLLYGVVVLVKKSKNHEEIAVKINKENITKEEITKKISEIFSNSSEQINSLEIENLPQEVVETFAKEIYLEKELSKKARKSKISKNKEVQEKIKSSEDRILIDAYLQDLIKQNVSDEKVKEKYAELTSGIENKKEYSISHIVVKDENEAQKIYRALNEVKPAKKSQKFSELAKKYSIDKDSSNKGGKIGYVFEESLDKEIVEVISKMKKSEYSKAIKTQYGWQIIRLDDVKQAKITPFEEVAENIREQLIKDTTDEIYNNIFKDVKINFMINSNKKSIDSSNSQEESEKNIEEKDMIKDEESKNSQEKK